MKIISNKSIIFFLILFLGIYSVHAECFKKRIELLNIPENYGLLKWNVNCKLETEYIKVTILIDNNWVEKKVIEEKANNKSFFALEITQDDFYNSDKFINISLYDKISGALLDRLVINNSENITWGEWTGGGKIRSLTSNSSTSMFPSIDFTYIPEYGNRIKNLKGMVIMGQSAFDNSMIKVAVYIYVNGWKSKPYVNKRITNVNEDLTWECDISTNFDDCYATSIIAFVMDNNFDPPLLNGNKLLPKSLYLNSYAYVRKDRKANTFYKNKYKSLSYRPRIIISTDLGGSDNDDYQSFIHYLMYSDIVKTEGLISSPPRKGREEHIKEVLKVYAKDYNKLKMHSHNYPTYESLVSITKQGSTYNGDSENLRSGGPGKGKSTEGSNHIISMAKKSSKTPLYILVWGAITDVAQALFDEPSIEQNIRVYSIGSWNTEMDKDSRNYIYNRHKKLWWIENDFAARGMYIGGNQNGDLGNKEFVLKHVNNHGNLGSYFYEISKYIDSGTGSGPYSIKMGDTPSFLYIISPIVGNIGSWDDPTQESWGGRFKRKRTYFWTDLKDGSNIYEIVWESTTTVSKWREYYLRDWQKRMDRLVETINYRDRPVDGDYDGDGKADPAFWRERDESNNSMLYIIPSSALCPQGWSWHAGLGGCSKQIGLVGIGDIPVGGDYDGDGKADPAIWREKDSSPRIYIRPSSGRCPYNWSKHAGWGGCSKQIGLVGIGDIPVGGDYDGDGKTDPAIWREKGSSPRIYIRPSSGRCPDNWSVHAGWGGCSKQIGLVGIGDIPVGGDYDGDGKADPAIWREKDSSPRIYIRPSSGSCPNNWSVHKGWGGCSRQIGLVGIGDIPVAGDYDGDGKADPAIWREKKYSGYYPMLYIRPSSGKCPDNNWEGPYLGWKGCGKQVDLNL